MTFPGKDSLSWVAEHMRHAHLPAAHPPSELPPSSLSLGVSVPAHTPTWLSSLQVQSYWQSEPSSRCGPSSLSFTIKGFLTPCCNAGPRNMTRRQREAEGVGPRGEEEKGGEGWFDTARLACHNCSVTVSPWEAFSPYNLDTITGRLPVAVMPATPPLPPPLRRKPRPLCRLADGKDVPCLIKRGCGPLMNTVSISLKLLLPLINMQCSMKEHCHPCDMIFIVCAGGREAGSEDERTEVRGRVDRSEERYISDE